MGLRKGLTGLQHPHVGVTPTTGEDTPGQTIGLVATHDRDVEGRQRAVARPTISARRTMVVRAIRGRRHRPRRWRKTSGARPVAHDPRLPVLPAVGKRSNVPVRPPEVIVRAVLAVPLALFPAIRPLAAEDSASDHVHGRLHDRLVVVQPSDRPSASVPITDRQALTGLDPPVVGVVVGLRPSVGQTVGVARPADASPTRPVT
ncbi:hypothetical protein KPB2_5558 [Klebsiella pneumoniae Kb677]|nr:hypothetical protein KPB2_5558 [Klebsiella pneumoniae Kb677]